MKILDINRGLFLLLMLLSYDMALANVNEEFPARKLYPAVPYIELDDLYKQLKNVVIVDVRSEYEYETLRIKGALNIPLSGQSFIAEMEKLQAANPKSKIVVYCNGKTCKKSYQAVQKCRDHNMENVIAYDAGIMDWAKKYPQESVLLGVSPIDPSRIIPKSALQEKEIGVDQFEAMLANKDVIVLDVRERFQREGLSLFPGIDKQAYLDDKAALNKYINLAKKDNKTLLIYDAAGKQVQWLMYYLEDQGLKKYMFMKGGANAYFAALRNQYVK